MAGMSALQQLEGKKRTYEDLSRFMGARTSGVPNYALLLGAGCSVSSGVRSASALVEIWREEVFRRLCPEDQYEPYAAKAYLTKNSAGWYNSAREYSSLFEKNFDLPRQRRMFVEEEVSGKSPNLGYAYLMRLVDKGFINSIFTTNFDDLLNEAFFQFSSTRPVLCAHDSSVASITVSSKRPKIVKLHGDYLFDDIKSTVRETESLEENTRKKLIEFGREFGLVVAGYSGCDRSVMDVLHYLLRSDDYFKHGIYWCIRKGDEPSDELLKLLWRDRVYFVEIDGFDEVMASLHNDLVGDSLPIDTSLITEKPKSIIENFCSSTFLVGSSSPLIKRDLEKLKKLNEREEILNVFRDIKGQSQDEDDAGTLSDKDFLVVMEIRRLINASDLNAARTKVVEALNAQPGKRLKDELLDFRVMIEEACGDAAAALTAIDAMLIEDSKDTALYVRKTHFVPIHDERMHIIKIAEEINPYDTKVIDRKIDCLIELYFSGMTQARDLVLKEIESSIADSFRADPGPRNPTWYTALDFYRRADLSKEIIKEKLDKMIADLDAMDPSRTISFRTRLLRWSKYKDDRKSIEAEKLLKDISETRRSRSLSDKFKYEWLEMDAYKALGRADDLSRRISELDINPDFSSEPDYLRRKSNFSICFNGELESAIESMRRAVAVGKRKSDIKRLAMLLKYSMNPAAIKELVNTKTYQLNSLDKADLKKEELEAKADHEGYLAQVRQSFGQRIAGVDQKVDEVHALLLLKRYEEASKTARSTLDSVAWSKEHPELIINFELAEQRAGRSLNKKRISELMEVCSGDLQKGCCAYLLAMSDKAKACFTAAIREDREDFFVMRGWAVFADDAGEKFLEGLRKTLNL